MFRGFFYTPDINEEAEDVDVFCYNKKHSPIDLVKQCIITEENGIKVFNTKKLQENAFLLPECDIFISYSHNDINLIKTIATKIENKTGLHCFIDDLYWNSADALSEAILQGTGLPDNVRKAPSNINYSDSTVYMLLCNSILKMIDSCEMFLFIDTPNSFALESRNPYAKQRILSQKITTSPWIFTELEYSKYITRRIPARYSFVVETPKLERMYEGRENFSQSPFKALYQPNTSHLSEILDIDDWLDVCSPSDGLENLDILYKKYPSTNTELTSLIRNEQFSERVHKGSKVYVNIDTGVNIN